jgi:hypothetical protein
MALLIKKTLLLIKITILLIILQTAYKFYQMWNNSFERFEKLFQIGNISGATCIINDHPGPMYHIQLRVKLNFVGANENENTF